MGEMEFEQSELVKAVNIAVQEMNQGTKELRLSTPGRRLHVRWNEGGSTTAMGQLAFFAEFLEVSGLFSRWVADCPLTYTSPNAPAIVDIPGTWLLSIFIERNWCQSEWQNAGNGFHAVEGEFRLTGRSYPRWVVVLRRAVKGDLAVEVKSGRQPTLNFIDHSEKIKLWEYTVLVTNTDYSLEALGQLYRDRADCENGFNELKNQWRWGGYTTHDLECCNLSARAVALIYNWWSWYVRLALPKRRPEAITSYPMLLSGIARMTQHAGQSGLLLTLTRESEDKIKSMIVNIRAGLDAILSNAPQLPEAGRWPALVRYIISKIIAGKPQNSQLLKSFPFALAFDSG